MVDNNCYCGSYNKYDTCCEPLIKGEKSALSAEALMRSRYSAYVTQKADYILASTHISQRKYYSFTEILQWASSNQWLKLEILKATHDTVDFKAYYLDGQQDPKVHHEVSTFKLEDGKWYYLDGKFYN